MSETPSNGTISPWWALLLIPIGLLIGWGVAVLPLPVTPSKAAQQQHVAVAPVAQPASERTARQRHPISEDGEAPPQAQTTPQQPRTEVSPWMSYESAVAESRRNGKPILIDFNAEWCPPCQRMKQQVFDNWRRGQEVQTAVIPVSIVDRAREDGSNPPEVEGLQRQYGVEAFPTLIVFSPRTGR